MPLTRRFGVEEEYVLLDDAALVPVSAATLHGRVARDADGRGRISREFLTCQVETATDPVSTLVEAREQLRTLRRSLADHAPDGTVVAATGAPFALAGAQQISPDPHYDDVMHLIGRLTADHEVNGLHVHVEVTDDEERVRALRRVREWLPALLALSVNSPFVHGMPSGLASWRTTLVGRMPVSECPPAFHDADDYHRTLDRHVRAGALPSRASVSWPVRLSEHYATVETRVADAQLLVDDSLLLTALIRGIVCATELHVEGTRHDLLDAGLWLAARHGMRARLFAPDGGEEDAWSAVQRMLGSIRPVLDELGDTAFVDEHLGRIRAEGTGAERQLAAHASQGAEGLAQLYRRW
ncbi:YbdK family carboxylate-amine ligase [Microbacterium sp.]|uniref:carboxylate-amine ligase n=1 Tax=Microbacterium sp. TaxID=51671 RepID=UPI0028118736|nr:YbdK family carboxylate-amine ligase [Microbacterium sp.]